MIAWWNTSIKKQLLLRIFFPIVLLFFVVGGVALYSVDDEIGEITDAQLAHSAKILKQLAIYDTEKNLQVGTERENEQAVVLHSYEKNLLFRVWKRDRLVAQSSGAEYFENFSAPLGFSDRIFSGEEWRQLVFLDHDSGIRVEVAEKNVVRDELLLNIMMGLLIPLSVFIPLLLVIVWLAIDKGLNRLVVVSRAVDQRESNDFTEIDVADIPAEIQPLVTAFNRLLQRIQGSFERERYFTDNAAHELRTPLAALKTQIQVLLLKTKGISQHQENLNSLQATIDRATHMVDQLLSFSRLQSDESEFEIVDFSEIVEETLRHVAPLALEKGIEFGADIEPGLKVRGDANACMVMIRNLVHNAIKFTSEAGYVDVLLLHDGRKVILKVIDNGPGISDDKKEQVFERFYRINKNDGSGSGLGLSMVKWVCDMHNAEIALDDNTPAGLVMIVSFDALKG